MNTAEPFRYLIYWARMIRCALSGGPVYFAWLAVLAVGIVAGGMSYYHHLVEGLVVTNMSDQVSWGIGIANFTFFVGVADAVILLAIPAYIYKKKVYEEVMTLGLVFAVSAVVMCLLFIVTDLGHPERFIHLIPPFGRLNLPYSMLAWDVVAFNVYLVLNLHIPGYLLYTKYLNEIPKKAYYLPLIFISIGWAIFIHTITAFLLSGLGSRAFWNTAILAPRFLISAFASGPAFLIAILWVVRKYSKLQVAEEIFEYLKRIMMFMLPVNLFLLGCEIFKEFYTNTLHAASAYYLYFGLHGHNMLTKFIWTATVFNIIATIIFLIPKARNSNLGLFIGCVLATVGIWVEKGMGLIFPGFIPSPLGEIVEYAPNFEEILVCVGVLSLGFFMFTLMAKVVIAIQTGDLRVDSKV